MDTSAISDTDTPAQGRTRRNRGSEVVRDRLVTAGIAEFAAHGFEGASTRRIAQTADTHQSQIKYHFENKDELWKRCLVVLLDDLDETILEQLAPNSTDPRNLVEAVIRGLVAFASYRPELNRIMMHEATSPSDRLNWLVETHTHRRQRDLISAWTDLQKAGLGAPIDADLIYHTVIGAASLLYSNAPEAVLMGIEPTNPELIKRHADTLVSIILTPKQPQDLA